MRSILVINCHCFHFPKTLHFLFVHADTFQSLRLRRCWKNGGHSSVPLMSPCKEQSATLNSFYPQLFHLSCTTRVSSKKLIYKFPSKGSRYSMLLTCNGCLANSCLLQLSAECAKHYIFSLSIYFCLTAPPY